TQIVSRHEILRTTFHTDGGVPVQRVHPPTEEPFTIVDVEPTSVHVHLEDAAREPFDLENGPLFRVRCYRMAPDEHMLGIVLHHIVADGWSLGVLRRELLSLYDAACKGHDLDGLLPPPPVQYGDYAIWQRAQAATPMFERQRSY